MKSHQKIENSTWRPETTINCRRRCALPALTLPLSASVAPPTARWSSGYTGHRGGREEKQRLARKGSRVCVSTMKLGRGCQGQEGQRDDLPEDTHSHQSTHPRPHIEERSGRRTRRATSRIYGSLRGKAGRASEKRRGLSTLSSHCEAPHMGLAAADTKGQAAEGAVRVKMNVNEKSTGVPDAWGSRRRGRSERKIRRGRAESGSRHGARFAKKEASKENELD